MPKQKPASSFDVQGTQYLQGEDRLASINQVVSDIIDEDPSKGLVVKFQGPHMVLRHHLYARQLDEKPVLDRIEHEADQYLAAAMRTIKAKYRERTGKVLSAAEERDKRDRSIQKVNMNGGFYAVYTRVFKLKEEA